DVIRDFHVTGVQTCALPISTVRNPRVVSRPPSPIRTSILPGSKIQSWPAGAWLHTDGVVPNPPRSPVIGWLVSNTFSPGHSSGFPRALHRSVVGPPG